MVCPFQIRLTCLTRIGDNLAISGHQETLSAEIGGRAPNKRATGSFGVSSALDSPRPPSHKDTAATEAGPLRASLNLERAKVSSRSPGVQGPSGPVPHTSPCTHHARSPGAGEAAPRRKRSLWVKGHRPGPRPASHGFGQSATARDSGNRELGHSWTRALRPRLSAVGPSRTRLTLPPRRPLGWREQRRGDPRPRGHGELS